MPQQRHCPVGPSNLANTKEDDMIVRLDTKTGSTQIFACGSLSIRRCCLATSGLFSERHFALPSKKLSLVPSRPESPMWRDLQHCWKRLLQTGSVKVPEGLNMSDKHPWSTVPLIFSLGAKFLSNPISTQLATSTDPTLFLERHVVPSSPANQM